MRTEREKMLAGEPYDCGDPDLLDRWHKAKELQKQYFLADTRDRILIDRILDELIGSRGEHCWIAPPFYVDYGENIHLGNSVEINMNCVFLDCNTITIGDHSGIGPGTHIYAVTHPTVPDERLSVPNDPDEFPFWKSHTAPVTIGRNVWIAGGCIILPGVTIGDNTTVGAGSVVTKSLPSNCLAAGNPCKIIRNF
ncbi:MULTISPECIES: sugar O-acetyltransferase [unclassified Parabacteroides]|uniref:sugar O-acetyltransferase n=1 Tax=unclassified Parabacteroides TaxID=2649774 RepID=UPI002475036C|nr:MULTISPECIES: sugar O-acetyltransferase [unclassified Parabacteroides]